MSNPAASLDLAINGQCFSDLSSVGAYAQTEHSASSGWYWTASFQEALLPVNFGKGAPKIAYFRSSPCSFELVNEALPVVPHESPSNARTYLHEIQSTFGDSASDLAKILRVSRPMIYHYREGKIEPSVENFRRMTLIKNLACEVNLAYCASLAAVLKSPQPEGKTLLALLSDKTPNVPMLRRMLFRASEDVAKRKKVAESIAYASSYERQDVMRDRHARGLPVYVSDPEMPGRIVQVRPDKSTSRGRMVNRVFVADEE